MTKNIYDDEAFFSSYAQMDRSQGGLEASGEWHLLEKLIPFLEGKKVLDLGCGYGWHSDYFIRHGASKVVAFDSSIKMVERAKELFGDKNIDFSLSSIEDYEFPEMEYDLVFSNLVLHYVEELEPVFRKIHDALVPGGVFLFNIEHPVFTSGVHQEFVKNEEGDLCWPITDYFYQGERKMNFLDHEVVKFHHSLNGIIQPLLCAGFALDNLVEAYPSEEALKTLAYMKVEMLRPMMLLVRAVRKQ